MISPHDFTTALRNAASKLVAGSVPDDLLWLIVDFVYWKWDTSCIAPANYTLLKNNPTVIRCIRGNSGYAVTDPFELLRGDTLKLALECRNTRHRGRTQIKIGAPVEKCGRIDKGGRVEKGGHISMSRTARVCLHFRRVLFLEIEVTNTSVRIYRFPSRREDCIVLVTNKLRLVFACEHEQTEIEIKDARFA